MFESGRKAIRKEARNSFLIGGGIVLFHLVLLICGVIGLRDIFRSILFLLGFAIIAGGVWELRRAGNLTLEDLKPSEQEIYFAESLKRTKPVFTWVILACLIAVGICQPVFESKESIEAARLVKGAMRQGEWWRLLTCAMLHVNHPLSAMGDSASKVQ